jgi:uncharacterized protein YbcV (DUF1398 family)
MPEFELFKFQTRAGVCRYNAEIKNKTPRYEV